MAGRTSRDAFCIGPGDDIVTDPVYSFTKTMDEQVEHFAERVRNNIHLAAGFNAMGLSQGNLIIRAYSAFVGCLSAVIALTFVPVQRYNDPPVLNFISVHGPHAGTASVPRYVYLRESKAH